MHWYSALRRQATLNMLSTILSTFHSYNFEEALTDKLSEFGYLKGANVKM